MNRLSPPYLAPAYGPKVTLRHRLPTRLRLEIPALRDGTDQAALQTQASEAISKNALLELVESSIGAVEGVSRVEANSITGSLLVEHDGEPGREAAILMALYSILPLFLAPVNKPRLLTNLNRLGMTIDQVTWRASKGWIDLETALPLLLALYGLSELLFKGRFRLSPSLMILWRAYTNLRDLAHDPGR